MVRMHAGQSTSSHAFSCWAWAALGRPLFHQPWRIRQEGGAGDLQRPKKSPAEQGQLTAYRRRHQDALRGQTFTAMSEASANGTQYLPDG